jgi:hypothetical protein
MSTARIEWIGEVAFGVELVDDQRQLAFDLAEGQSVPSEFKAGDLVEIDNRPEHPAMLGVGINQGHYVITHTATGKSLKVMHRHMQWRVEK